MSSKKKAALQKNTKVKPIEVYPETKNEEVLHQAFKNSHLLVLSIDQEGVIKYCNHGIITSLKKTESQLVGKELFSIFEFNIDENVRLFDFMAEVRSFEAKVVRQSWPKLSIRFDTIIHKSQDIYTGITLVGENITETENTTKALEKSNAQLKELFDNSNDLIQIFDSTGKLLFTNEAWKIRLGYIQQDLKSLQLKDIIHPTVLQETGEKLKKLEKGHSYERFETVLVSKYGKKIYVTGSINCTMKNNAPTEFRAIFFDITERIRAERAQMLYYKIASLTIRSSNLQMLYNSVFSHLKEVLGVKNMTVALHTEGQYFEFPFFINEMEGTPEITNQLEITQLLSQYTFDRKKSLIIYDDGISKIAGAKNIVLNKSTPKIWMGVIIYSEEKEIGVISVHANEERQTYNFKDLELLDFISSQVSLAIERKWNEAKINSQSGRIKAIFESSTHQIWSLDKDLRFTSFNQNYADAIKSYYGTTPKLGSRMDQLATKKFNESAKKDWEGKYKHVFEGNITHFQTFTINMEGKKIWRDVFLSPIFLPDGTIEEISAIANDITEKKLAEEALHESEEKFRNIFESFQDIYFRCDFEGNITLVSPSVKQLLGYDEIDYLQKPITSFFQIANYRTMLRRLLKDHEVRNFDAIAKTKMGDEINLLCNIRLIYKNGNAIGMEGVARDITQLKEATEELMTAKLVAERSLKIKERFLANMSHEIRTPMNGIIGMIDLIASTRLNKEQLEYIKTIKKSSDTLLNILNDILDLSKIEAGKMELKKTPINLAKTIEKLYALYSQEANRNQTSIFYRIDENIPEWNMIDETRLLQVLSNLTSNAIKFSDGKGNISISMRLSKKISPTLHVYKAEIKDAGIGISKKDIQKLFETFSQIDNSLTKNYSGTGLGLAISKELVKSMNGKIGVASTPGLGSTFWFTFEAEIPTEEELKFIQSREETSFNKQFTGTKPKVLLVDDNAINRKVASQILRKSGCKVSTAESGQKALLSVKKNGYDLIFMDIQMPGLDGIQTTQQMKALRLKDLPPVVAMTAYSMEEDKGRFIKLGMDDYISKPIKAHTLIQKVKEHVGFDAREVKSDLLKEDSKDLIINQNTLNQLFKYGGEEIIKSVLEEFDKETGTLLKDCKENLAQQKFEVIRRNLHTIKGNAGTLGAEKLFSMIEAAEIKLKEPKLEGVDKDLKKIIRLYEEFKKNYKSIIKGG